MLADIKSKQQHAGEEFRLNRRATQEPSACPGFALATPVQPKPQKAWGSSFLPVATAQGSGGHLGPGPTLVGGQKQALWGLGSWGSKARSPRYSALMVTSGDQTAGCGPLSTAFIQQTPRRHQLCARPVPGTGDAKTNRDPTPALKGSGEGECR